MLDLQQFDGRKVRVTYNPDIDDESPDTGFATYDGTCAFWPYTPVLLVAIEGAENQIMVYQNETEGVLVEDAGGCTLHVAQVEIES